MQLKRIGAMILARHYEFIRDRGSLGWNFLFPFLLMIGCALLYNEKHYQYFKVGVFPVTSTKFVLAQTKLPLAFQHTRYLEFIPLPNLAIGQAKLRHHQIDFLIHRNNQRYWISTRSPQGYLVERLYHASRYPLATTQKHRCRLPGYQVAYLDWLFPGILAMNMMFASLWGVGYVIVRYRQNGVLKRLQATPLTPFEYLTAQMCARLCISMLTLLILWGGIRLVLPIVVRGSLGDILIVFLLGEMSLTSLGVLLASRSRSEEFTSGLLNCITLPMMFLAQVWFSIEGAPCWIRYCAELLPLTHVIRALRKIMHDGVPLSGVSTECAVLASMSLVFLSLGALLFKWYEE